MNTIYYLFAILFITLILFVWGYWRYDVVSFFALMASVLTGVVPFNNAFSGFSNSAVIVVACVMILASAVSESNMIYYAVRFFNYFSKNIYLHVLSLCITGAFLSCFINNVGALGLMMPIAVQTSLKHNRSPSLVLMPLAFSSILGGLMTAIGSPTNLIISHYRDLAMGSPYQMFDFTQVGFFVAFTGIIFISLFGWRLISLKPGTSKIDDMFEVSDYTTEIKVLDDSPLIGKKFSSLKKDLDAKFSIIGIIRNKMKIYNYSRNDKVMAGDEFIIEASDQDLKKILDNPSLKIAHEKALTTDDLSSSQTHIIEAVVRPGSTLEGKTARSAQLRTRYAINLLAISRTGKSFKGELGNVRINVGDVALLQGDADTLQDIIDDLGFIPLAERKTKVAQRKNNTLLILIFLGAIIVSALQILPVAVSFSTAILILALLKILPVNNIYKSIDWGILLSIAAMLPIGDAMVTTGAAELITNNMILYTQGLSPYIALSVVLIITMLLSNIVSNAAAAVIMAPIAIEMARTSMISMDTLLMGVVVGATCSFLTPVANQNNLLVMGPGSYHFKDYFNLGLPLQIIVIITAIPVIAWIWPF